MTRTVSAIRSTEITNGYRKLYASLTTGWEFRQSLRRRHAGCPHVRIAPTRRVFSQHRVTNWWLRAGKLPAALNAGSAAVSYSMALCRSPAIGWNWLAQLDFRVPIRLTRKWRELRSFFRRGQR